MRQNQYKCPVGRSWRMDDMYINVNVNVKGVWNTFTAP
jgi:transposase-like protein